SVQRFGQAVKGVTTTTSFGTNASGPGSAFECGQDYTALVGQCDFVQPLLGYIDWHVMQPINAWQDFLTARVHGLATRDAAAISATLFGLGDGSLSSYSSVLAPGHEEGTPEGIQQVVLRQLDLLEAKGLPLTALLPVLRGRDWPTDVTRSLAQLTDARGFGGVVYQGATALASPVPVEGWA
ncbi:MAG TPA: hypothetical protein VFN03_08790, partial [Trueperaceae bacterium]|nr:hypothetical protein [Trueperaceae bacterium]